MSKPVDLSSIKMSISVTVPVSLREKLRMGAAAEGISMARLVQNLIEEAFALRTAIEEEDNK